MKFCDEHHQTISVNSASVPFCSKRRSSFLIRHSFSGNRYKCYRQCETGERTRRLQNEWWEAEPFIAAVTCYPFAIIFHLAAMPYMIDPDSDSEEHPNYGRGTAPTAIPADIEPLSIIENGCE